MDIACVTQGDASCHCTDAIMIAMGYQIISLTIVCSTFYSGTDKKHQSSASLALVRGIRRWPVNTPHKGPVARKVFPFDDVIIKVLFLLLKCICCAGKGAWIFVKIEANVDYHHYCLPFCHLNPILQTEDLGLITRIAWIRNQLFFRNITFDAMGPAHQTIDSPELQS